ncbi:hypothetical protein MPDQ_000900 [Monascus purpureus]|uniref:Tetrapyrrole biosynthesis uroporphyrinogen III synthase domain-containing protein n=1 Tax=Monascus purpureus TaxID=5098 RepID=A0A507R124_MONPU|nr:hypothetical protein MPDQ_000900 [Monascus purpureus]BDD55634.1 hypothetical protein MAP00_001128 [Monascus purpureus]
MAPPNTDTYNFTSTPILLLKTKSTPHDGYEEFFSARGYHPIFVPVLEHRFNTPSLDEVKKLFVSGSLNPGPERKYGGLIFTSQRAVEGFARLVVGEIGVPIATEASRSLLLYTVGPATSRSLGTLRDSHLPYAEIHGSNAGNGENLAKFILEHYNSLYHTDNYDGHGDGHSDKPKPKPPLLFLVGEQRRDIIPKTLMSESLPDSQRITVHERVVYETAVMESFEEQFRSVVDAGRGYLRTHTDTDQKKVMWVVVFSPTGCDAMLRVLELGPSTTTSASSISDQGGRRRVFVATIGPTTRDYLRLKYGVQVDVCAQKPSQDGVGAGIEEFMLSKSRS